MPKSSTPNIHDKFFRSAMTHHKVAVDFIQHNFPKKITDALDTDSLKLMQQSYIDQDLQENISDLVFSCNLANKPAYLTLLIEHQSSADKMMPFRTFNYLFGVLNNHYKQQPKKPLPAIYIMVFYHGDRSPYPYSLALEDCFDDPLKLMRNVLSRDVPLTDVNQLSDEALQKQQWIGPMVFAMKHIRQIDMTPYALKVLASLPWNVEEHEGHDLLNLLLKYVLHAGNIDNINAFIRDGAEQLPRPIRSELMTFAEKMEEQGIQKGLQKGMQKGRKAGIDEGMEKVALKMLAEGIEVPFITKITGLSQAEIKRLQKI